jgi:hypothetical protein
MGLGRTALFYKANKKARDRKKKYDTKYHSTKKRKKYRAELNRERRKRGIYGKGGKDLHHKKGGGLVLMDSSKNRAMDRPKGKKKMKAFMRKKK